LLDSNIPTAKNTLMLLKRYTFFSLKINLFYVESFRFLCVYRYILKYKAYRYSFYRFRLSEKVFSLLTWPRSANTMKSMPVENTPGRWQ
jgi:hypothetical protein